MGIEIERKFLVRDDGWRGAVQRSARLAQAYLGGDRASVRIRIDGTQGWLNLKSRERGVQRLEFEYPVPLDDAEVILAQLSRPGRIDKLRHFVPHAGMLWEVDEFFGENAGLVVAEIELESVDQSFETPSWLGDEVSDDLRFYNSALVEQPFLTWPQASRALIQKGSVDRGQQRPC